MNLLTASLLEPYVVGDKVHLIAVHPGEIEIVDLVEIHDPKKCTNEERALINKQMAYRWRLPRDLLLPGETPGCMKERLRTIPEIASSIIKYLRRYVWFRKSSTYELLANWVIATYFRGQFQYQPIIIADGITETGKSTLAKSLELISYRAENWISCSAAAIAREIEDYDATIIMDEAIDALQSERGGEIFTMIRSCFEKGQRWIRADPKGRQNYVYNVYTSMALCIRGVGLPEDVYNRGIRINMTPAPAHVTFGDLENWADEDHRDRSTPEDIRSDLYALKIWSMAHPEDDLSVRFAKEIALTRKYVSTKCGDVWYYAHVLDIENGPMIRGRDRNIASTLFSVAQHTGTERGVIEEIIANTESNKEVYLDTAEAMTFISLMELVEENHARKGMRGELDYGAFCRAAEDITTTDVAARFNLILEEQGNAGRDRVPTKTVTAKINALGFKYERRVQNKSYMVPSQDFASLFMHNVRKYASPKAQEFKEIMKGVKKS